MPFPERSDISWYFIIFHEISSPSSWPWLGLFWVKVWKHWSCRPQKVASPPVLLQDATKSQVTWSTEYKRYSQSPCDDYSRASHSIENVWLCNASHWFELEHHWTSMLWDNSTRVNCCRSLSLSGSACSIFTTILTVCQRTQAKPNIAISWTSSQFHGTTPASFSNTRDM